MHPPPLIVIVKAKKGGGGGGGGGGGTDTILYSQHATKNQCIVSLTYICRAAPHFM